MPVTRRLFVAGLGSLIIGCLEKKPFESFEKIYTSVNGTNQAVENLENKTIISEADADKPYPEPNYRPTERAPPYRLNKSHDLWRPEDPTLFITPDNEWVKHYASRLYIDHDGRIRYKDAKVPWTSNEKGETTAWIGKPFLNNYVSDDVQFNYPPNGDVWVLPEYYLTNGMADDCDGWAVTVESLMLSGYMSVKQKDGAFKKQKIPAKAVLGYIGAERYRDAWVEYKFHDNIFLTTTGLINTSIGKVSSTSFEERRLRITDPVFEFDNKHFGSYQKLE